MKILVAMSGGVDSSVAAARAVDAGHEVVGVHLALSRMPGTLRTGSRGCCTIEDSRDAHRVAGMLDIPFYVWDFSERFKEDIVDDFIAEYAAGRTPNPCMRCNERIKFAALLDRALALGFDAIATGHYAEVLRDADGQMELHRGEDLAKDQSYVLGVLSGDQLEHCYFPIGATASKAEVRAEAAERGFSVANKPDSYDICFIPDGDTKAWLADKIPMRPGLIKDDEGEVLGEHDGAMTYTIGQRKGLGIQKPAADGQPRFVTGLDPASNTVTVGSRGDLAVSHLTGIRTTWAGPAPADIGTEPATAIDCEVQIRAHSDPVPARAWLGDYISEAPEHEVNPVVDEVEVPAPRPAGQLMHIDVDEELSGVAPGQTMVIYRGTRVLGQATIDMTARDRLGV
ncbi:MAG: tRNA 2-thiouridine(34) synthase MnmA [Brevibacterium sp.]|uniref:tRNA 2-thiouridine(34) synthase MnmA n=1 Tax=Brevibacterium sp. TaxID=1701 RepID=UPI002647ECC4|nr:tRNA 2-thiouridine(34) synthase MnmA [Brevibacterium sp.]MDN5806409.1 tRNA 2-thiouridine(34) synthase MnmA [Brevibacterium sp.]MDN5832831.1 tRNA 2-thiouridine(34) synthase MnmA [Brevibacterium sp.]MDN5875326.1 tRNA 2-thiouridine(34) synthase MnmA [Brevibacterium sp.]MDN5908012.1 tRNA 2-thiouridine(34) synthase MnmA [Brevibacterium sp.]MDN6123070.1 tRNA 2-thiouridine(34) synthase MnmA [Brevibacterium sp.]